MSMSRAQAASERAHFLRRIGPETPFYRLFDLLPEVSFFAKDRQFRIMCANRSFVERFGFRDEAQIVGRNDFELFPPRLAENFRRDDEEVLRTGQPKFNIVELFFNDQGLPDWFVTSKEPLRDGAGRVMGLMGVVHSYAARKQMLHPYQHLDRALEHIRANFRSGITVKELAAIVHLSPRQLHRRFHEALGTSPQEFIVKLRIQAACEALQCEERSVGEIAKELGFCDQSNFTQLFLRHVGVTPLKYRQRFRLRRA